MEVRNFASATARSEREELSVAARGTEQGQRCWGVEEEDSEEEAGLEPRPVGGAECGAEAEEWKRR